MRPEDNNFLKWTDSEALNSSFENQKKLDEFLSEMDKIRADIDPRFIEQFHSYEKKVASILSENLSVISSWIVQEELSRQNARINSKFKLGREKIKNEYEKLFS